MLLPLNLLQFLLFRRLFFAGSDLTAAVLGTRAQEDEGKINENYNRIFTSSPSSKNALQNIKTILLDSSQNYNHSPPSHIPNYLTALMALKSEAVEYFFYPESLLHRQSSIPLAVAAVATFAGTLFDTIIILLLVAKIIIALIVIALVIIGIALGILELTLQLISKKF